MKTILMKTMIKRLISVKMILFWRFSKKDYRIWGSVRDPETPRNSGWPTVSGQPLRCLNVSESGYGILGASWIEGISIEIGD